jgi:hypothetical protein
MPPAESREEAFMRARVIAAAVSSMIVLAACNSNTAEPVSGQRQPGVLQLAGWPSPPAQFTTGGGVSWSREPAPGDVTAPVVIQAPDTVSVGTAFQVVVFTVGISGCWRADGQEVSISNRVVALKPYDRVEGEVCTQAVSMLPHQSSVTLNAAGIWTLRVTGRRTTMGPVIVEELITAEKTVFAK